MSTSQHAVAIFEEGFMLVAINHEDVENNGEKTMCDAIQEHPWVLEQEIPVVIVYQMDDGQIRTFGPAELVEAVSQMNYDDIVWGHELTLEWEEKETNITKEPQPAYLNATLSASIAEGDLLYHELVLDKGCRYNFSLDPEDENADLDFYITDSEGNIVHQDEDESAGAAGWFIPGEYGIYRLYVQAATGSTNYVITFEEEQE